MVKYARITYGKAKSWVEIVYYFKILFSFLENANSNEMDPSKTPDIKRINSNDLC